MNPSLRLVRAGLLLAAAAALVSCQTPEPPRDYDPIVPRFLVEVRAGEQGLPARLPYSGVMVEVNPKAFFAEFDVAAVELVRAELGPSLLFQLNPDAAREFYRFSLSNRGRRLVLTLNGQPVGIRSIDQPVGNGILVFFPEIPQERLAQILIDMRKTLEDVSREIDRMREEDR